MEESDQRKSIMQVTRLMSAASCCVSTKDLMCGFHGDVYMYICTDIIETGGKR